MLLELLDADAERSGNVLNAPGERRVDVPGERRKSLCEFVGPGLQRLTDLNGLGADALRDFASAVAERSGGLEGVARQRFRQRPAALGKPFFNPRQQNFERRRKFPELCARSLVYHLQTSIEQGRGLLVPAAKLLVDLAAAGDKRLLNRRKLGAEIGGERC